MAVGAIMNLSERDANLSSVSQAADPRSIADITILLQENMLLQIECQTRDLPFLIGKNIISSGHMQSHLGSV